VNLDKDECSVAPVFPLKDINRIVCGILGWTLDTRKIDAELEKVRKTLQAQAVANGALFDPESASEEQVRQMEELKKANDRINDGIEKEIRELGIRIQQDLSSVQGEY
jgi:hypothetical protein